MVPFSFWPADHACMVMSFVGWPLAARHVADRYRLPLKLGNTGKLKMIVVNVVITWG